MMAMVLAVNLPAWADVSVTTMPVEVVDSLPLLPENANLNQLTQQLELIRQSVPIITSDERLEEFRQGALQVQQQTEMLLTVRATDMERLDDQLKVLGAVQPGEAQSLTVQRDALTQKKNSLLDDERQAKQVGQTSRELAAQIVNLRRNLFNSPVTSRTDTPLAPRFGRPLSVPILKIYIAWTT